MGIIPKPEECLLIKNMSDLVKARNANLYPVVEGVALREKFDRELCEMGFYLSIHGVDLVFKDNREQYVYKIKK